MAKSNPTPDTTVTITLPGEGDATRTGTLLIQRGDLAHLVTFDYSNTGDIADAIHDASEKLLAMEVDPPVIDGEKAIERQTIAENDPVKMKKQPKRASKRLATDVHKPGEEEAQPALL